MDNFTPNGNGQKNVPQNGNVRNGVSQNGGSQNFARPSVPQREMNGNAPRQGMGVNNVSPNGVRPSNLNGQRVNVPNANGQNVTPQNFSRPNAPVQNGNRVYPNTQNQNVPHGQNINSGNFGSPNLNMQNQNLPNGQNANINGQANGQGLNRQNLNIQNVNAAGGNGGGNSGNGKVAGGAGKKKFSKKFKGILIGVISAIIIAISATVGIFVAPHGEGEKCRITFEDMGPYGAKDAIELNVGDRYEAPTLDDILSDDGQENVLVKFKGWLKSDGTPYVAGNVNEDIVLHPDYELGDVKVTFVTIDSYNNTNSYIFLGEIFTKYYAEKISFASYLDLYQSLKLSDGLRGNTYAAETDYIKEYVLESGVSGEANYSAKNYSEFAGKFLNVKNFSMAGSDNLYSIEDVIDTPSGNRVVVVNFDGKDVEIKYNSNLKSIEKQYTSGGIVGETFENEVTDRVYKFGQENYVLPSYAALRSVDSSKGFVLNNPRYHRLVGWSFIAPKIMTESGEIDNPDFGKEGTYYKFNASERLKLTREFLKDKNRLELYAVWDEDVTSLNVYSNPNLASVASISMNATQGKSVGDWLGDIVSSIQKRGSVLVGFNTSPRYDGKILNLNTFLEGGLTSHDNPEETNPYLSGVEVNLYAVYRRVVENTYIKLNDLDLNVSGVNITKDSLNISYNLQQSVGESYVYDASGVEVSFDQAERMFVVKNLIEEATFDLPNLSRSNYLFEGYRTKNRLYAMGETSSSVQVKVLLDDILSDGTFVINSNWRGVETSFAFDLQNGQKEIVTAVYGTKLVVDITTQSDVTSVVVRKFVGLEPILTFEFEKEGYNFLGMSKNAAGGEYLDEVLGEFVLNDELLNVLTSVDGIKTIFACWEIKTVTATFVLSGGTFDNGSESVTGQYSLSTTYGGSVELPSKDLSKFVREGYNFDGWFDNSNLSGEAVCGYDATDIVLKKDITLFAKWVEIKFATIFSDYNKTKSVKIETDRNGNFVFAGNELDGMTFVAITQTPTGGEDIVKVGEVASVSLGEEFYCVWRKVVYQNGGTAENGATGDEISGGYVTYGVPISPISNEYTCSKYFYFAGWQIVNKNGSVASDFVQPSTVLDESSTGYSISDSLTTGEEEKIVLVANWQRKDVRIEIYSDENMRVLVKSIKVDVNKFDSVTLLSDAAGDLALSTINGRDIDFVKDDLQNSTAYYSNGSELKITIPKDSLIYEVNNVFVYKLCAVTKKYATFFEEENGRSVRISVGTDFEDGTDRTGYAENAGPADKIAKEDGSYVYDAIISGGVRGKFVLTSGEDSPFEFSKEHYNFDKWQKSDGVNYAVGESVKILSDVTFVAQWVKKVYSLNIKDTIGGNYAEQGGVKTVKFVYGQTINLSDVLYDLNTRFDDEASRSVKMAKTVLYNDVNFALSDKLLMEYSEFGLEGILLEGELEDGVVGMTITWEEMTYQIVVDLNGGSWNEDIELSENATLQNGKIVYTVTFLQAENLKILHEGIEKQGYTFSSFLNGRNGNVTKTSDGYFYIAISEYNVFDGDNILATYNESFSVVFDLSGADELAEVATITQNVNFVTVGTESDGDWIEIILPAAGDRGEGFEFAGWWKNNNATDATNNLSIIQNSFGEGSVLKITRGDLNSYNLLGKNEVVLYAVWKAKVTFVAGRKFADGFITGATNAQGEAALIDVDYNANGQTISVKGFEDWIVCGEIDANTLGKYKFEHANGFGFVFGGWNENGKRVFSLDVSAPTTLVAEWASAKITITLRDQDGKSFAQSGLTTEEVVIERDFSTGDFLDLNNIYRTFVAAGKTTTPYFFGHNFVGWVEGSVGMTNWTSATSKTIYTSSNLLAMPLQDSVYCAVFEKSDVEIVADMNTEDERGDRPFVNDVTETFYGKFGELYTIDVSDKNQYSAHPYFEIISWKANKNGSTFETTFMLDASVVEYDAQLNKYVASIAATWTRKTSTIVINVNGGTIASGYFNSDSGFANNLIKVEYATRQIIITQYVSNDSFLTLPTAENISREMFVLNGYNVDNGKDVLTLAGGNKVWNTESGRVVITANWLAVANVNVYENAGNEVEKQISFQVVLGEGNGIQFDELGNEVLIYRAGSVEKRVSFATFAKANYEILGFSLYRSSGVNYQFDTLYALNNVSTLSIYTVWVGKEYSISIYANDPELSPAENSSNVTVLSEGFRYGENVDMSKFFLKASSTGGWVFESFEIEGLVFDGQTTTFNPEVQDIGYKTNYDFTTNWKGKEIKVTYNFGNATFTDTDGQSGSEIVKTYTYSKRFGESGTMVKTLTPSESTTTCVRFEDEGAEHPLYAFSSFISLDENVEVVNGEFELPAKDITLVAKWQSKEIKLVVEPTGAAIGEDKDAKFDSLENTSGLKVSKGVRAGKNVLLVEELLIGDKVDLATLPNAVCSGEQYAYVFLRNYAGEGVCEEGNRSYIENTVFEVAKNSSVNFDLIWNAQSEAFELWFTLLWSPTDVTVTYVQSLPVVNAPTITDASGNEVLDETSNVVYGYNNRATGYITDAAKYQTLEVNKLGEIGHTERNSETGESEFVLGFSLLEGYNLFGWKQIGWTTERDHSKVDGNYTKLNNKNSYFFSPTGDQNGTTNLLAFEKKTSAVKLYPIWEQEDYVLSLKDQTSKNFDGQKDFVVKYDSIFSVQKLLEDSGITLVTTAFDSTEKVFKNFANWVYNDKTFASETSLVFSKDFGGFINSDDLSDTNRTVTLNMGWEEVQYRLKLNLYFGDYSDKANVYFYRDADGSCYILTDNVVKFSELKTDGILLSGLKSLLLDETKLSKAVGDNVYSFAGWALTTREDGNILEPTKMLSLAGEKLVINEATFGIEGEANLEEELLSYLNPETATIELTAMWNCYKLVINANEGTLTDTTSSKLWDGESDGQGNAWTADADGNIYLWTYYGANIVLNEKILSWFARENYSAETKAFIHLIPQTDTDGNVVRDEFDEIVYDTERLSVKDSTCDFVVVANDDLFVEWIGNQVEIVVSPNSKTNDVEGNFDSASYAQFEAAYRELFSEVDGLLDASRSHKVETTAETINGVSVTVIKLSANYGDQIDCFNLLLASSAGGNTFYGWTDGYLNYSIVPFVARDNDSNRLYGLWSAVAMFELNGGRYGQSSSAKEVIDPVAPEGSDGKINLPKKMLINEGGSPYDAGPRKVGYEFVGWSDNAGGYKTYSEYVAKWKNLYIEEYIKSLTTQTEEEKNTIKNQLVKEVVRDHEVYVERFKTLMGEEYVTNLLATSFKVYDENEEYTLTGDVTFYALWRQVKVTVTFFKSIDDYKNGAGNGADSMATCDIWYGESWTLPTKYDTSDYATKIFGWTHSTDGKQDAFAGWNVYNATSEMKLSAGETVELTSDKFFANLMDGDSVRKNIHLVTIWESVSVTVKIKLGPSSEDYAYYGESAGQDYGYLETLVEGDSKYLIISNPFSSFYYPNLDRIVRFGKVAKGYIEPYGYASSSAIVSNTKNPRATTLHIAKTGESRYFGEVREVNGNYVYELEVVWAEAECFIDNYFNVNTNIGHKFYESLQDALEDVADKDNDTFETRQANIMLLDKVSLEGDTTKYHYIKNTVNIGSRKVVVDIYNKSAKNIVLRRQTTGVAVIVGENGLFAIRNTTDNLSFNIEGEGKSGDVFVKVESGAFEITGRIEVTNFNNTLSSKGSLVWAVGGSVTFDGVNFSGNMLSGTNSSLFGGVICAESGCSVSISNGEFKNNSVVGTFSDENLSTYGGAVAVLSKSTLTINSVKFLQNISRVGNKGRSFGGAIYASGSEVSYYSCYVTDTDDYGNIKQGENDISFRENSAMFGGAIAVVGGLDGTTLVKSSLQLSGLIDEAAGKTWSVMMYHNFTDGEGESGNDIYAVDANVDVTAMASLCEEAKGNGAGIFAGNNTDVVVKTSLFSTTYAQNGSAIYFRGNSLTVSDSVFSQNVATSGDVVDGDGGAIYVEGTISQTAVVVLTGNVISYAWAKRGGAIYVGENVNFSLSGKEGELSSLEKTYAELGGAIYYASTYEAESQINYVSFKTSIYLEDADGQKIYPKNGGGIYVADGDLVVANSSFTFCRADNGGAVYIKKGKVTFKDTNTFEKLNDVSSGVIEENPTLGGSEDNALAARYVGNNASFGGGLYIEEEGEFDFQSGGLGPTRGATWRCYIGRK